MRVYSREFRLDVVRRILSGEAVAALSKELGIRRKVLYGWLRRVNEGGEASLRDRGRPRKSDMAISFPHHNQQRVAELERTVERQQPMIEFFRSSLQQLEELRHARNAIGAMASSGPSRKRCNCKAC
jgi:transposase